MLVKVTVAFPSRYSFFVGRTKATCADAPFEALMWESCLLDHLI